MERFVLGALVSKHLPPWRLHSSKQSHRATDWCEHARTCVCMCVMDLQLTRLTQTCLLLSKGPGTKRIRTTQSIAKVQQERSLVQSQLLSVCFSCCAILLASTPTLPWAKPQEENASGTPNQAQSVTGALTCANSH
eukprot:1159764-Pelagomonas_calceolata.AAC.4